MTSLRTGFITYGLDRPLTGIGRYTVELARALAGLGEELEITLLTAGGPGPLAEVDGLRQASLPGCRLLPGLMTLGNTWIPLRARRLGLDLIHDPAGVAPLLLGAGPARSAVTVHDVFAWSCPGTSTLLDTLIYRCWLPHVLPRVDAVITDSQVSRADIVHYLGVSSAKTKVIPLGISDVYRPVSHEELARVRSRHGLPERYVLFLGSVEVRKNLAGLLQAYACLRGRDGHLPLVMAGTRGRGAQRIVELVHELKLAEDVILTGYMADADLPAVYSGADLFIFPSLYEGFGLPPLEAMACGTPVVCSNAASLPEVVGDAAITVDPYDVEALAGAMQRVLADRDLQENLRRRGLERAAGFTWERTARETVEVYREVLNL